MVQFSLTSMEKLKRFGAMLSQLRVVRWLEVTSAVLTVAFGLATLIPRLQDAIGRGLYFFVCGLCVSLAVIVIIEEFRWHRKARYAEAQSFIHDAYHKLRDAMWAVAQDNSALAEQDFKSVLKALAAAWSLITGAACRVCVVDLFCADPEATSNDDSFHVRLLCRDSDASFHNSRKPDLLKENSDFYKLWSDPTQRWFMSNDLLKELKRGYRNSHWPAEIVARGEVEYIAACVWPIRKTLTPAIQQNKSPEECQVLLGYLCVDCKTRDVFQDRYDFHLGAAFADTMFSFIQAWRALANRIQTANKQEVSDAK
jgi:hypothetical protein